MVLKDATDKFRLRGRSIGRPRFLTNIFADKHRDDDTIMSYTDSSSCGDSPNSASNVEVSSSCIPGSFANSLQPAEGSFPRLSYHSTTCQNTENCSSESNEISPRNSQNGFIKIQNNRRKAVELIISPPVSESLAMQSIKKEEQISNMSSNNIDIICNMPQSNSDCTSNGDEKRIYQDSKNDQIMSDQNDKDNYFWINKQGSSISLLPVVKEDEAADHNIKDLEESTIISSKTWSPGLVGASRSTDDRRTFGLDATDKNYDVTYTNQAKSLCTKDSQKSSRSCRSLGSHEHKKKKKPSSKRSQKAAMEKELQARLKVILALKDVVLKQKTEIKYQDEKLDECGKKITAFQNVIEYLRKVHHHDQKKVSKLQHERDSYAAEAAFYREKLESLLNENTPSNTHPVDELNMFHTFGQTMESSNQAKSSQIDVVQQQNQWKDSNTSLTGEEKQNQCSVLKMSGNQQFHPHPNESNEPREEAEEREDNYPQSNTSLFDFRDGPHNNNFVHLN